MCGYTALVGCALALRCGSAEVMWYPYTGRGTPEDECTSIRNMLSKK